MESHPPILTIESDLQAGARTWLVTGAAGFIGSHLMEALLQLGQHVIGLDNFSTGSRENLEHVRGSVGARTWTRARIIEADIRELSSCRQACAGVDFVLHQAALGSVPRSLADPIRSHESNVSGFLNMLVAARDAGVTRFVYASSSSVYGDHPALPKIEESTGLPLSPYAATKAMNETYASVFARAFGLECIGLRYFNVFGPRQDPAGAYAAVIPRWIMALLEGRPVHIYGDGHTSRDFTYVSNVVQANLLAAMVGNRDELHQVFNIACGETTTLSELFHLIQSALRRSGCSITPVAPVYQEFRPGDVRHSHAAIQKAERLLGYSPTHSVQQGLEAAIEWYRNKLQPPAARSSESAVALPLQAAH